MSAGKNLIIPNDYIVGNLLNATRDVEIVIRDGAVHLLYPSSSVEQAVLLAGAPRDANFHSLVTDKEPLPSPKYDTIEAYIKSWGSTWRHVSLTNPELKFAVRSIYA